MEFFTPRRVVRIVILCVVVHMVHNAWQVWVEITGRGNGFSAEVVSEVVKQTGPSAAQGA